MNNTLWFYGHGENNEKLSILTHSRHSTFNTFNIQHIRHSTHSTFKTFNIQHIQHSTFNTFNIHHIQHSTHSTFVHSTFDIEVNFQKFIRHKFDSTSQPIMNFPEVSAKIGWRDGVVENHVYICNVSTFLCMCMWTCLCLCMWTCLCLCMWTCLCICMWTCLCLCKWTCLCLYLWTCFWKTEVLPIRLKHKILMKWKWVKTRPCSSISVDQWPATPIFVLQ